MAGTGLGVTGVGPMVLDFSELSVWRGRHAGKWISMTSEPNGGGSKELLE